MFSWLLWAAVGSTATLNAYGWPPVVSTITGSAFCLCWILVNVSSRVLVLNFLGGCCDVFFRQIVALGAHKLAQSTSPMLLAIAPHSNQFIDPMIVMKTLRRPIGFLCAAKSMRYKRAVSDLVAFFARTMESVPVERAQDLAKWGDGTIQTTNDVCHGSQGARFTEFSVGAQILVAEGDDKGAVAKIAEIVSDSVIKLATPLTKELNEETLPSVGPCRYKVIPKLQHSETYGAVYERLHDNGVVGIFPEGGSHDRSSLLPLKAGIAVMALGACQLYGEELRSKLRIVPVGLNYFSGHRFRSRVFVDYGEPFEISKDLVDEYARGDKRKAGDKLMAQILTALKAVTVQAPNHKTQELLYMLRRLYVTDDRKLTIDQKVAVTRGFASAFTKDKDKPQVQELLHRVAKYNNRLKQFKIHDRRVSLGGADIVEPLDALAMLGLRFFILLLYAVALVPGLILASPLLLLAEGVSQAKAKQAVKGSRVKLEGRDVLGTWKVLVGMIMTPILHFMYTSGIAYLVGYRHAVLYFFWMPFVSGTSIIASESFIDVARSIGPLWILIFDRTAGAELRRSRIQLQRDVRQVAQELGWHDIIHKSTSRADLEFSDFELPDHKDEDITNGYHASLSEEDDDALLAEDAAN